MHDWLRRMCFRRNDLFSSQNLFLAGFCSVLAMSGAAGQCDWKLCHHCNNSHFRKRERNEKLSWLQWFIYINIILYILLLLVSVLSHNWNDSRLTVSLLLIISLPPTAAWGVTRFVRTECWWCWGMISFKCMNRWLEMNHFDVWEVNFMHKTLLRFFFFLFCARPCLTFSPNICLSYNRSEILTCCSPLA